MSLQRELNFYNRNKDKYLKLYKEQFVLIKGEKFYGNFSTEEEAYKEGIQKFGNEPFFIKQVLARENTVSFSSLYFGLKNAGI